MANPALPPRVFVSCAPQDGKYHELVATKSKADRLPLAIDGMLDGRTDEIAWQIECRRRIRAACAVVVLVSPHTRESVRAMWQVNCAREEGKSIVGVTVGFEGMEERPAGDLVDPMAVIGWRWKSIAAVLMRLAAAKPSVTPVPTTQGTVAALAEPRGKSRSATVPARGVAGASTMEGSAA